VLGPNRRVLVTKKKGKSGGVRWTDSTDSQDIFYPVRRAFMIRAELGCKSDEKLAIDPGLLKGLLQVKNYEHGARSISKVVEPLRAARPGAIHLSRLGPRQQLALHVDATDFLTLCRTVSSAQAAKGSWDSANRESVAEAIHETYRRMGAEEGWLKTENDIDYQHIVEFYKRSNRAAADRMQDTLALVGLTLEPGSNTVDEREQVRLDIEHNLELLADAEHEGWMAWHLNQGWEYGPKKPDTNLSLEPKAEEKTHPCLKPYTTLSAVDRNKDRDSIRHYLDFAKAAEMKIVRQPRP